MIKITIEFLVIIIQYTLFFTFLGLGTYSLYNLLTTREERKVYRAKLIKELNNRKENVLKKQEDSSFQKKLKLAGLGFIGATRYQIYRISFIIVLTSYYLIVPLLRGNVINTSTYSIPVLLYIFTEPKFKYSLTSYILNYLMERKKRKQIIELFTLFDLLKAELNSLGKSREVNIYSMLKESLPSFDYINNSISRFLLLWRTEPSKAKDVFFEDTGEESAKILGDIIHKLDSSSKDDAIKILETESSVFTHLFYEKQLQNSTKQKLGFFVFAMTTNILIIAWLLLLVFAMFNDTFNNNYIL